MNQLILLEVPPKPRASRLLFNPKEFKVQVLRECPTPAELQLCDTADKAAAYWRSHVIAHPYFNPDVESFVALLLNTRRKVQGHGRKPKERRDPYGAWLHHLRKQRNLTQQELAKRTGVPQTTLAYWERTGNLTGRKAILRLAAALEVSIPKLLRAEKGDRDS
jgi:DNA-binding transcriptional regulator YiaG